MNCYLFEQGNVINLRMINIKEFQFTYQSAPQCFGETWAVEINGQVLRIVLDKWETIFDISILEARIKSFITVLCPMFRIVIVAVWF